MSNWREALAQLGVICPFCGETRMLELIGKLWVCAVCSKSWLPKP
jgi:ribosomal protein L37AE/L43A